MTIENLVEEISKLTVLEVSELVKALEDKFGVSAAAPVAAVAAPAAASAEEEQTEFDVILTGVEDGKKIALIKEVRALTGLDLKGAKEFVENPGKAVKEAVSKDEAAELKSKLEAAGGKIEIK